MIKIVIPNGGGFEPAKAICAIVSASACPAAGIS